MRRVMVHHTPANDPWQIARQDEDKLNYIDQATPGVPWLPYLRIPCSADLDY